jgi:hypothetical protein
MNINNTELVIKKEVLLAEAKAAFDQLSTIRNQKVKLEQMEIQLLTQIKTKFDIIEKIEMKFARQEYNQLTK